MPCYSRDFTLEVLRDKPYCERLSWYLVEQAIELDCNGLARLRRALDGVESKSYVAKGPEDFDVNGVLGGYGHFHMLRGDWLHGNAALSIHKQPQQSIEDTIEQMADKVIESELPACDAIDGILGRFSQRIKTGDWVIYSKRQQISTCYPFNFHTTLIPSSPTRGIKYGHAAANRLLATTT